LTVKSPLTVEYFTHFHNKNSFYQSLSVTKTNYELVILMLETVSDETLIDRISGSICRQVKMEDAEISKEEYSHLSSKMAKYIDINFTSNFEYEINYEIPKNIMKIGIDKYMSPELPEEKLFEEEKLFRERLTGFKTAYNQFKEEFKK
jgi:hypothetical protein